MKANYFKVGVFVMTAVALLAAAVVALGAGLIGREEVYFETYFDESVTGLTVGSPVELRGVRIGEVSEIGFASDVVTVPPDANNAPEAERYVRVVFAVSNRRLGDISNQGNVARLTSGVNYGLRVRLSSNIITGQSFLEGTYVDTDRYPPPTITWKPVYRYIPSVPSELTTLKDSVDKIFVRLEELDVEGLLSSMEKLFTSLDQAVADARIDEISQAFRGAMSEIRTKLADVQIGEISAALQKVLESVDQAIADANVPGVSEEVRGLFAESRETNEKLLHLLADPETQAWQGSIPETVARLNRALTRIDRLVAGEQPQISELVINLVQVTENLKDLTEMLKQNPAGLIRSVPPERSEALK